MHRFGLILGPALIIGGAIEWILRLTHYLELIEKHFPWTEHMTSPTGIWITLVIGMLLLLAALAEWKKEKELEGKFKTLEKPLPSGSNYAEGGKAEVHIHYERSENQDVPGHLDSPIHSERSQNSKDNSTSPVPPPQQTISAPNGIAIGGGTVTNPTVNNYGPLKRQLTEDERDKLIAYLRPHCPFEVVIRAIPGNAESMEYADQIARAIKDAGCTVGRTPWLIDNAPSYGIDIAIRDINDIPAGADALAGAFRAAGIQFKSVAGDPVRPKAVYVMVNLNGSTPQ